MKNILLGSTLALTIVGLGAGAVLAEGGQRGGPQRPSFEQLDTNGDGMVTKTEMQASAQAKFSETDTNGDGMLSVEELTAAAERERGRMIQRLMARKDANGDGMLSVEEMAPPNGDRLFERADANADGAISLEEWDAAKAHMREGRGSRGGHGQQGNNSSGN